MMTGVPSIAQDATAAAIAKALQQNGRKSYADIGKVVGLSREAVRRRIRSMVSAGVMQIVAVTVPAHSSFARRAMICIRCTGDTSNIAEKLSAIESVAYVALTAGSFDAIVEVVCENDAEPLALLNNKIRAVPGVISTETLDYLKLVHHQYDWGNKRVPFRNTPDHQQRGAKQTEKQ